ncbi:hypothetical protein Q9L58_008360 [Maublancomyces gigas]|uniref:Uncharacterized protein n=1 Tax=Discina gigas TaxID=1032678 RepID=A0ABR3GAQ2_9PEZI
MKLQLDELVENPNIKSDLQTALHLAAEKGHAEIVNILLNHGAQVEATNKWTQSPLQLAAETGHLAAGKELLDKGANVHPQDIAEMTVLHWAAIKGRAQFVQLLLEWKANQEVRDNTQRTAFDCAIKNKHKEAARALRGRINVKDQNGQTALHRAAIAADLDTVQLLMDLDADMLTIDNAGETPLEVMAKNGLEEAVQGLEKVAEFLQNISDVAEGVYNFFS